MFGNGRFGKNRFAGGTPSVGVSITPDAAVIVFLGQQGTVNYGFPALHISTIATETLHSGNATSARISTTAVEVVRDTTFGTVNARVSTIAVEVIRDLQFGANLARVSTIAMEVVRDLQFGANLAHVSLIALEVLRDTHFNPPKARVSTFAVEVLRSIATASNDNPGFVSIIWGL